jgi:hypothetical protein
VRKLVVVVLLLAVVGGVVFYLFNEQKKRKIEEIRRQITEFRGQMPEPDTVDDEAMVAGRDAASFPAADEDYFADMDYGVTKDPEAVRAALEPYVSGITAEQAVAAAARGRNNWIVWTAGNDRFWDLISRESLGSLDLLKTLSNHPSLKFSRDTRWQYLGLVNEPCFAKGEAPREDRYGLWLDVRSADCPPDPFENEEKYPGVEIGARGKNLPAGSFYGYATGIVGLRLFPNPDFDEAAEAAWDSEKYYEEEQYYNDRHLVKPYRVGMSCGFCHVGPNPTNPPADPENPEWANLTSNPGAQYFWIDRIFMWDLDQTSFVHQLFGTSRPGALDTSLVSSDQINNPRTMNAIYNLAARLEIATKWGEETLDGGGLDNAQLNQYVPPESPLNAFFEPPATVLTPRVLKDGSDSVGALGALNRVFVNIGLFSEEWVLHFTPLIGGAHITPFPIETARRRSSYWNATEAQTPDLALFFLATAKPDYLRAAPGGEGHLTADEAQLTLGKEVFAATCARCHSSKQPEKAFTDFFPGRGCVGPDYLSCWDDWWQWTKTDEYKGLIREIVLAEDFLENNFLSTELRVPVTLLETNACSPLATNAIAGNIWDNFSSASYKSLPSVGTIQVHHPTTGEPYDYPMPADGRGYTRPASLVSLWSTAPYLLNNTVGEFEWTGSIEDRMASFEDGIEKLLWPERRDGDRSYVTASGREHPGVIDRTSEATYLFASFGFLPEFVRDLADQSILLRHCFDDKGLKLGPIPSGTPINLLANIDLTKGEQLKELGPALLLDFARLRCKGSDERAREVLANLVPGLLAVNKCPDFVVNRGHYFGTDFLPESEGEPGLSEEDKRALIEFLKTL